MEDPEGSSGKVWKTEFLTFGTRESGNDGTSFKR